MLSAARYLQSADSDRFDPKDHRLFEYCCAWNLSNKTKKTTLLWDEINPDLKDEWFLPEQDVGIDYATINKSKHIFGQAKCYKKGGRIKAHDINRTMLCATMASVKYVEFATKPTNVMGNTKIPLQFKEWDTFLEPHNKPLVATHTHISNKRFKEFYEKSIALIPKLQPAPDKIKKLRKCQQEALQVMNSKKYSRIKMACGSGKTYTVIKHILDADRNRKYIVLVPSLVLMTQWASQFKNTKLRVSMIGTGQDRTYRNDADVFICVYNSFPGWWETVDEYDIGYIYVDEAHHIDKAVDSYLADIQYLLNTESFPYTMLSATLHNPDYTYDMRTAIDQGILTDYDILVPVYNKLNNNTLLDIIDTHPEYNKILIYFNSIAAAKAFKKNAGNACAVITCNESLKTRNKIIADFKNGKYRVIASVNTLGEGVDIRCADTCIFGDHRSSEISIIQCVGRILRKYPGKNLSHIVVPMSAENLENNVNPTVLRILAKIAKYDSKLLNIGVAKKRSSRLRIANKTTAEHEIDEGDFEKITELLYKSTFDNALFGAWDYKFNLYKEYYQQKGLPKSNTKYKNVTIGVWQDTQRKNFKQGKLPASRIKKLNKLSPDILNPPNSRTWDESYSLYKEYYQQKGLPAKSTIYKNVKIGNWQDTQRQNFRQGKLPASRIKKLNKLSPEILNPPNFRTWDEWYDIYKEYYQQNGLPVHRTKYKNANIGKWKDRQRQAFKNGKLSKERIALLDAVTLDWQPK